MEIIKNIEGTTLTLALEGRLDTNTAANLEKELNDLTGIETLIFDLGKLEYISSSGLRILLTSQKMMNNKGNMIIKNVSQDIKEIFEITGFSSILTLE